MGDADNTAGLGVTQAAAFQEIQNQVFARNSLCRVRVERF
jgi:hypothetical protein